MSPDQNIQRTLVILKPDAVQRGIAGDILARFERRGLRIVALRLAKVERALAEKHYEVHKGKFFYDDLVKVISASPVIAFVLEGPNAIAVVRAMVGLSRLFLDHRPWLSDLEINPLIVLGNNEGARAVDVRAVRRNA